jgi:3-deoxy-7-phosphoheptulonate synthase
MDIIVLKPAASEEEIRRILKKLERRGLKVNISKGTERTIIGVIGDTSKISEE